MEAPKIAMVLPVRFSFETRAVQTTTREISTEGVFVRCLEPPEAGSQVGLKIYLPGLSQAADFIGVVREVSSGKGEGGFWAEFVSADGQAHQKLLELLDPAPSAARPAPGPVPLASLYKRAHVQPHPQPPAPPPPPAAQQPPAAAPPRPDPPPEEARRPPAPTPMTALIQGAITAVAAEKAAEVLGIKRPSQSGTKRTSQPGAKEPSQPGAKRPSQPGAKKASQPGAKKGSQPGAPPPPAAPDAVQRPGDVVLAGDAINRRAFPRYRARFAVRFPSVQDFVLEYAANISAGGVFVVTQHPPEMDAVITVVLELPDGGEPVACKALVVHRVTPQQAHERGTPAGVGVQFIEADDRFRERIDQTIELILRQGSA